MKSRHVHKLIKEAKNWLVLFLYFAIWFSALVFYNDAILHSNGVPYVRYSVAILQAFILSKFMISGQVLFPLQHKEGAALLWTIVRRSLTDTGFVLFMSYFFAGIEGAIKRHGFIESMQNFCGGDPTHVAALTILYWLIVLPYVAHRCLSHAIGEERVNAYLMGTNKQP